MYEYEYDSVPLTYVVHYNKVPVRKCKVGEKRINKFLEHRYHDKIRVFTYLDIYCSFCFHVSCNQLT